MSGPSSPVLARTSAGSGSGFGGRGHAAFSSAAETGLVGGELLEGFSQGLSWAPPPALRPNTTLPVWVRLKQLGQGVGACEPLALHMVRLAAAGGQAQAAIAGKRGRRVELCVMAACP